jgi:hypothetical protein
MFEILKAASVIKTAFWITAPCSPAVADYCNFNTFYKITWHNIPEGCHLKF